jgi:colicin import membrane protein/SWI/SNF-related matrix-associated actin-dependent regulator 1 of chromatin subfamily A
MGGVYGSAGAGASARLAAPAGVTWIRQEWGAEDVAEKEGERLGKGSAADLLSAWRAAERDHAAASEAANVAQLASDAAQRAAEAARETADAARLSLEAAQKAERAARETSEAAEVLGEATAREQAAAAHIVDDAAQREAAARDAFRAAQEKGFPKGG